MGPATVTEDIATPRTIEGVPASVLSACRAAAVDSPAASRAVLAKYRSIVNPSLAKTLEHVGGYDCEVALASVALALSFILVTIISKDFSYSTFFRTSTIFHREFPLNRLQAGQPHSSP